MEFRARGGLFGGFNLTRQAPSAETDADVPPRRMVQRNNPPAVMQPQSADFLIFSLGFTSVVCLVFITGDLLSTEPLSPVTVTIFVLASSYCGVLVRRQRTMHFSDRDMAIFEEATAVATRAEGGGSFDGGRQNSIMILNKDRRRQVLDYFVYRRPAAPPEDEEKDSRAIAKEVGGGTWASDPDGCERGEASRNRNPNPNRTQSAPPSPRRSPPLKASHASPDLIRRRCGGGELHEEAVGMDGLALEEGRTVRPEVGGSAAIRSASAASNGVGDDEARNQSGVSTVGALKTVPDAEGTDTVPLRGLCREWSTSGACIICFSDYSYGEELCRLPCHHLYHARCIDAWFDGANHAWCPLCKANVLEVLREAPDVSSSAAAATASAAAAAVVAGGNTGPSAGESGSRSFSGMFAV